MSNTKQLFESIQNHLNEAVFEIDYAGDGDLSTEEAIMNNVKEWLGDLSDKVKVEVKEVKGPGAGWPEVRLIGDKELIGTFLNKEYNSGADSLEDTYDLYLLKESDEVPYCDDVNCESVKEAEEEEEVQTEEQPQEEVQTEEPVNDFEQLSPEVQTVLNDMSNDNAMYKWVIDDVMDSDISSYDGDSMDEKLKSRLEEIVEHGCQSGTVGSLIYYTDTVKFFDNFNDEIYDMVEDIFGAESVLEMLQRHCELIDIVMGADIVKNYLAWMAYEVTCSNILDNIESV